MKLIKQIHESAGPYVYHATMAANIMDIMKKGLTFFNDSLWVRAGAPNTRYQGDDPSIYAFTHPVDAWRWAHKIEWEYKTPAMILKIKNNGNWEPDPSADSTMTIGDQEEKGKAVKSDTPILPADIVGYLALGRIPTAREFDGDNNEYEAFVKHKIINS